MDDYDDYDYDDPDEEPDFDAPSSERTGEEPLAAKPVASAEELRKRNAEHLEQTRGRAGLGDPKAQYELGDYYLRGGSDLPHEHPWSSQWKAEYVKRHGESQYREGAYDDPFLMKPETLRQRMQRYLSAEQWTRKAANQGYPPAQYRMSLICGELRGGYAREIYAWRQRSEASRIIMRSPKIDIAAVRQAAAAGDPEAQYMLGDYCLWSKPVTANGYAGPLAWKTLICTGQHSTYKDGDFDRIAEEDDYQKAFELTCKSAKQGCSAAQHRLSIMYKYGLGVPANEKLAGKWDLSPLVAKAKSGDAKAQCELAEHYEKCKLDQEESRKWYLAAARNGYADAQFKAGGFEKDPNKALEWFRLAAKGGNADAMSRVAAMEELKRRFSQVLSSAKNGDPKAQYRIAVSCENGSWLLPSFQLSKKVSAAWMSRAFQGFCTLARYCGDAESQYVLACMYRKGEGCEPDEQLAFDWTLKAAEQGYKHAQWNMVAYFLNCGTEFVEYNEGAAREWYEKYSEEHIERIWKVDSSAALVDDGRRVSRLKRAALRDQFAEEWGKFRLPAAIAREY